MVTGLRSVAADIVGHGLPLVLLQASIPAAAMAEGRLSGCAATAEAAGMGPPAAPVTRCERPRACVEGRGEVRVQDSHSRLGATGFLAGVPAPAFRLGAGHGVFCVGCCWALMLVAFAAGVANLWWMAALTAVMVFEKTGRGGQRGVRPIGLGLVILGIFMLAQAL
jgi:hypothetical protein